MRIRIRKILGYPRDPSRRAARADLVRRHPFQGDNFIFACRWMIKEATRDQAGCTSAGTKAKAMGADTHGCKKNLAFSQSRGDPGVKESWLRHNVKGVAAEAESLPFVTSAVENTCQVCTF